MILPIPPTALTRLRQNNAALQQAQALFQSQCELVACAMGLDPATQQLNMDLEAGIVSYPDAPDSPPPPPDLPETSPKEDALAASSRLDNHHLPV